MRLSRDVGAGAGASAGVGVGVDVPPLSMAPEGSPGGLREMASIEALANKKEGKDETEILKALKHVQEQLALQQQQFLQMQFTNMQMQATPGGMQMPGMAAGTPAGARFPPSVNQRGVGGMTPLAEMMTPGQAPTGAAAPSQEEINEYAVYLGMDPAADKDLLYIAEWALSAPLPEGWTEHVDTSGNEFYFNSMTGVSTYEHPLDGQFREYYRQEKSRAGQAGQPAAA